jgi:hypothetical protein
MRLSISNISMRIVASCARDIRAPRQCFDPSGDGARRTREPLLSEATSQPVTKRLSLSGRASADGSERHGGKTTTCDCAKSKAPGMQRVPTARKLLT